MNPFFEYILKSTISLSLLYLLFKVFMQNDKTLVLNRFLLLGILIVSAIIPLLNFQFFQTEVPVKQVELIREFVSAPLFVSPEIQVADPSVLQPMKSEMNYWMLIYGATIFILVIRLFVSVGKVLQLIRKAEKQKLRNIVLAVVKEMIQPFTFLNHVVLSEKDLNENKKIIVAHEQAHIKQLHAIDLAVCEVFTLLHFFNPLMWLLRRDLKLIHEYQADQAVLNKGIDAQNYQLLVLQKAVGERRFALANNFSQKPILKRIKMMKRKKNRWNGLKLMLFVPLTTALLMSFSKTVEITSPKVNLIGQIVAPQQIVQEQNEKADFIIEIKRDGNYIDNKIVSLEEVVKRAKSWQKTGREDILLLVEDPTLYSRIDEVRLALDKSNIYHVNQSTPGLGEIIYPHGDVSKLAQFSASGWGSWLEEQIKKYTEDKPEGWNFRVRIAFIIDKNGKVREGRIMEPSSHPEINSALKKILTQIPDWKPAIKGNSKVSVLYTGIFSYKI
jgi:beta-lactamase regulating signal transducer with metallopeptidase domain